MKQFNERINMSVNDKWYFSDDEKHKKIKLVLNIKFYEKTYMKQQSTMTNTSI